MASVFCGAAGYFLTSGSLGHTVDVRRMRLAPSVGPLQNLRYGGCVGANACWISDESDAQGRGVLVANHHHMFHDIAGEEKLTQQIIGCAIRVHEALGPGLFESIYIRCLVIELTASGLEVDTNRRVPVTYRGQDIGAVFCPDIIVDNAVLVELKAVESLVRVHKTQVITYLKVTGLRVGLLINFNVDKLSDGVRRVVRPDLYVKSNQPPTGAKNA